MLSDIMYIYFTSKVHCKLPIENDMRLIPRYIEIAWEK